MSPRQDTLFERFLAPIARLAIDEKSLRQFYESLDWQAASARLTNPSVTYPPYYRDQHFHGIEHGYLTIGAAVTYDPITQYALPPNETWVRQAAIDTIQSQPRRILDLGCGTGSTTLLLKQAFPHAEVIGLDLSPYMLVVAEHKAQQAGLDLHWHHGRAEQTSFPDASFDLVTASLLFHETPPQVAQAILNECQRLLTIGGEVVILDGSQTLLRQAEWLTQIFEEPYIRSYAAESVDAWMSAAGFGQIETRNFWWLHQITRGVKPLKPRAIEVSTGTVGQMSEQWALG